MSYIKAADVLPEELLILIQKYVDGEYIYIPKMECNRKTWGEITQSKQKTYNRNLHIYKKYKEGTSINVLSKMFYLYSKSIQKIIMKMKNEKQ